MKINFYKPALIALAVATTLVSCINDDDYATPVAHCVGTTVDKNMEVSQIAATSTLQQYLDSPLYQGTDAIEAYVTSSDKAGNFYKTISFQTIDGSKGFSVSVDAASTYINYEPGRKVVIKLDSLYYQVYNSALTLGTVYLSSSGNASVGRIPESRYKKHLLRTCTKVNEDAIVQHVANLTDLKSDSNLHKLIELDNVQFTSSAVGHTYYDSASDIGSATNYNLEDATGSTVIFRTSAYADFAGKTVPSGNGKIRGVLTKYGSDYQFFARYEEDVKLEGTRQHFDANPPLVGSSISYGLYNETFESYATANRNFPNAINDPAEGARYWQVATFGSNKYIQMTSFGGTPEVNRTLFIVPIDFTQASTFSFQSKDGYNNGAALRVYYSTNYTPGSDITTATLVDITSNFAIATGSTSGYATNFTNSGVYNIPAALTGNGFFIFEYKGNGSGGTTTTMQLDNIVVQ